MSESLPEVIVEIANSHDGNQNSFYEIIDEIVKFPYQNKSLKLQIFSAETIALKDYEWYETYKKITFNEIFWERLLDYIHKRKIKIWVDIFDIFGANIVIKKHKLIHGIKIQASVIENIEVRNLLRKLKNKKIQLILNISGYSILKIKNFLDDFRSIGFSNIILQIGFQKFPTKIEDTGLQKIKELKKIFPNSICIADHVDAADSISLDIPIFALSLGADLIEKHICLNRDNTKYDAFSSLNPSEFYELFEKIENFYKSKTGSFISKNEKDYLSKSIQIPISKSDIKTGSIISADDLIYRRSSQKGINFNEIKKIQSNFHITNQPISKNTSIKKTFFSKARIAVIVAGRMKSQRLKKKATLAMGEKSSIVWCLESCLKFPNIDKVILATSTLEEDLILKDYLPNDPRMFFFQGEPDDVISRYIEACRINEIDVIIRVTADCPFVSSEIATILLREHFAKGADYTAPLEFAVGTNCEIINLNALEKVIKYMGKAQLSEYMTWYFQNNPKFFKLNLVHLPNTLIRDYRLTLDFKEDLQMFERMLSELKKNDLEVNLSNIYKILDENPNIVKINSHIKLKYKTDKNLISRLNMETKIISK